MADSNSDDEVVTNEFEKVNDTTVAKSQIEEINSILNDYASFDVESQEPINDNSVYDEIEQGKNGTDEDNSTKLDPPDAPRFDNIDLDTEEENANIKLSCTAEVTHSNLSEQPTQTIKENYNGATLDGNDQNETSDDNLHENSSDFENKATDSETSSIKTDTDSVESTTEIQSSMLSFPNDEMFDLNDPRTHSRVIKLCRKLFKTLDALKDTVARNEEDIGKRRGKISKMGIHIKDLQGKNGGLNSKLQGLIQELEKSKEQLKAHDTAARNAINRIQKESNEHIQQLKAKCLAMQKDKDAAVMNYARREKEVLDAKRVSEAADKKSKDAVREKEKAIVHMKGLKMDLAKLKAALEKREAENTQIRKDTEKWKEEANSHIIKVKWAQNKLKSETDSHSETKEKLAKALVEIKRSKEEAEQIRKNCQGMIKTYQESEEMRSNSLDSQLKEKEMLLSEQEAKSGELEGIHKQQLDELRKLKQQHKDVMEENVVIKTRVECLEKERLKNEETLKGYSEILNRQKREAVSMSEELKNLDSMKALLLEKENEIKKIQQQLKEGWENREQMKMNEENWKTKEQELLEFTQKVSSKNAQLASETENLVSKLKTTSAELTKSRTLTTSLENELKAIKSKLDSQNQNANDLTSELQQRLQDKETSLNQLTVQLEEVKDEIRTLNRKNNANIKDLTRQLHHARKKLEPYESGHSYQTGSGPGTEDGVMGSRTSSDTSLDLVGRTNNTNNMHSHNSAAESGGITGSSMNGTDVPETVVASSGEISTQTLIERIVRLQRIHARKNEKIDFLHDHVQQLVDEMQKKNKIIQHYMLREESGMLMPQLATPHAIDLGSNKMSHHLTVEVNRKMQSVLEDTLLKNIALKESVDALGREVAKLSNLKKS